MAVLESDSGKSPISAPEEGPLLGEIRTGFLRNSGPIGSDTATYLLSLLPQQKVRRWERPVRHAAAPDVLTGVDCLLPSAAGRDRRVVGTIATDVRITGGQIVQAATRARIMRAEQNRRLSWSHYLTRPGVVEAWGQVRIDDAVAGFLNGDDDRANVLDLGSPSAHRLNTLQASALLDGAHNYRPERTRLRWAAEVTSGPLSVAFSLESPRMHTLRLRVPAQLAADVSQLCQDVALHDWLLCSVIDLLDRAAIGGGDRGAVVRTLAPAIDHLLHAWLPGARIGDELMAYWTQIDRRSGLSRQWQAAVQQIRDQIALATVELTLGTSANGPARQVVTLP